MGANFSHAVILENILLNIGLLSLNCKLQEVSSYRCFYMTSIKFLEVFLYGGGGGGFLVFSLPVSFLRGSSCIHMGHSLVCILADVSSEVLACFAKTLKKF